MGIALNPSMQQVDKCDRWVTESQASCGDKPDDEVALDSLKKAQDLSAGHRD
jgi:hypothetical protein